MGCRYARRWGRMATTTPERIKSKPDDMSARGGARAAAADATEKNSTQLKLPYGIGVITLPAPQRLAWYGGVTVVATAGLLEWPVAVILIVGHLLAEDHHNRLIHDFGEGLAEV